MSTETYLNHPTFGLLYRVSVLDENKELYTTLYAQRLFFLVTTSTSGLTCEPISRSDSRLLVENRLRVLRRAGQTEEYNKLTMIHQRTFQ
ncbi:MAG TPA: PipX family protein [Phormidium sp.]